MKSLNLGRILSGRDDPEDVLPTLAAEDLAALADVLFSHLDTPDPEFGAQAWYDSVVDEISRRTAAPNEAATGVA